MKTHFSHRVLSRSKKSLVLLGLVFTTSAIAAEKPPSITPEPWQEAVVSVTDLDQSARFFREIGGYETLFQGPLSASEIASWGLPPEASGEALLLGPAGHDQGLLRLVRFDNAGRKEPTRPGSRPWDTGCYFSLMVRMKDMQAIYDDAIAMGWWTETPITDLEFGTSKLKVVIYRGPDGVQVQGYERLEPPLPAAIGPFERLSKPFNMMQMVRDRDASYHFYTQELGFDTFYNGKPYLAETPEYMPLGIPYNLTTEIPYRAGIVFPQPGEFGRMETIEIMGLEGRDYADRCRAPNLGILAVRFWVDDAANARDTLLERGATIDRSISPIDLPPFGSLSTFDVRTPDGALIQFMQKP